MRAALYGRVSTSDRDQNSETQMLPMREFVVARELGIGYATLKRLLDARDAGRTGIG